MENYEDKMGTEKMLPLILKMAIPSVIAQLVNMLYNIVDRVYIGRIPNCGTNALAGIGLTSSIIILISSLAAFISGGGAPLASIALGQGNHKKAEKILGNGFTLLLIFSLCSMVFTYLYMTPILQLIGASDNVIGYATDYLRIYLIGTFFVQITIGLNPFINAQGRPQIGMTSILIGAIFNIILDPIFIFALHMGVAGAATATVISQFLSAIWILRFLTSKQASLKLKRSEMLPDGKIIGPMLALGVSSFVMMSTESLIGFVLNYRLSQYGDIHISTLTVLQSMMQMVTVPVSGFTQGFIPVFSYNYGHKEVKRLKEGFRISVTIVFSFMFLSVVSMLLFRTFTASIFTDDPILIDSVCRYMPYFMFGMSIFGLQRTCQSTFVALGEAKVSIFIALLRKIILLIPLSILLSNLIGARGVYLAEGIADATAAILCTIIFSIKFPKLLQKIDNC